MNILSPHCCLFKEYKRIFLWNGLFKENNKNKISNWWKNQKEANVWSAINTHLIQYKRRKKNDLKCVIYAYNKNSECQ